MVMIARWESKSKKHWVELHRDGHSYYGFRAVNWNGTFAPCSAFKSDEAAIRYFEAKRVPDFQPDANTTPLVRVALPTT